MRAVRSFRRRSSGASQATASTDHTCTLAGSRPAFSAPRLTSATARRTASSDMKVWRMTPSKTLPANSRLRGPNAVMRGGTGSGREAGGGRLVTERGMVQVGEFPGHGVVAHPALAAPEPPQERGTLGELRVAHRL